MPKLLIKRNTEWANKLRDIEIVLNGETLSLISDNELLEFDIPEGEHRIQAKIDWCGSRILTFRITGDEVKRIEVSGFVFSKYLLPVALVVSFIYLALNLMSEINSLFLGTLMMFLFGFMLYFITFGRKDYLQLKEVS
ncbi:hypothetical protein [Christiangramia salexigens]|uniref:Uncharacterized protein n=1 Tax=Christiangramia salexigens TaxID=1913577 RepID=A0A1L3J3U9_9FLAO|nr:hypothetical protein [Christiangramia salexigens]APG59807.1 hypothetical protein LPB144_04975 [Christiangramia salexigens]